ncbi:hypothetical protein QR685DRAFT_77363 [Neurospora intermedia]|uniref:Uncharacterized protein n=1 Tax=Neurospora intermedia TaxID=5142 RepID=A0ABR3D390_NEUIN
MEWMSGGDSPEWACAGLLLVNRFLLGRLFAPTKKLKAARYINLQHVRGQPVYPAWLLGTILGCRQGQGGAIYLFFGEIRSSGWMRPAEAD